MANAPLAPVGTPERLRQVEDRAEMRGRILLGATVLILLFNIVYSWLIYQRANQLNQFAITISDVKPLSAQDICPGDTFTYQYTLHISAASGVVEFDATVWSAESRQTTIYSSPFRMILMDQETTVIVESWTVPMDQALARQISPWKPGRYERRLGFRNIYQATTPAVVKVPFRIREDCV